MTSNAGPFIIGVLASFEVTMQHLLNRLWYDDQGQDIAEYAVMLAVILLLVVGTIKLIGTTPAARSPA